MIKTALDYIVLFHSTKNKATTPCGLQAVKVDYHFHSLDLNVEVYIVDEPTLDWLGIYDSETKCIIVNVRLIYNKHYNMEYVVFHEYFHSIQHLALLDETEGEYYEENCTTEEEIVYDSLLEQDCISIHSYAMEEACEMGAELFCALLGFEINIEIREDLKMSQILSFFYKHVIEEVPRYKELYNNLKSCKQSA